ncbi:MAG: hypothetical protein P1V51_07825 [Deltaproteobacteria bacterium]|nr:hypothetical protein [Deltaproteobacteria bacterium]
MILEVMGRLGTDAMAVGPRDVAGGVKLLQKGAAEAGIALLSANLETAKGRAVFPASVVLERGGLRVGVIGVSTADLRVAEARAYLGAKLTAAAPAPAVQKAAAALKGKADVIVLLGRLTTREQREVVAAVDLPLALIGSSGQAPSAPGRIGRALAYEGGFRGQVLQRVDLRVSEPGGGFRDGAEREIVPAPPGLKTPNDASARAIYLDAFKAIDPALDALLEPVRSEEELEARKKGREKAAE